MTTDTFTDTRIDTRPAVLVHPSWCAGGDVCTASDPVGGAHRTELTPVNLSAIGGYMVAVAVAQHVREATPKVEIYTRPEGFGFRHARFQVRDLADLRGAVARLSALLSLVPTELRQALTESSDARTHRTPGLSSVAAVSPPRPPCPPWCVTDHDAELRVAPDLWGHEGRGFQLANASEPVSVVVVRWDRGGRVGVPEVALDAGSDLTPGQARETAAALLHAAQLVDESGGAR